MLGRVVKDIFAAGRGKAKEASGLVIPLGGVEQRERGVIVCFYAGSEGNALGELIHWTAAPLKDEAAGIVVLDVRAADLIERLQAVIESPIWFAVSHFGAGQAISFQPTPGGPQRNLWEYFGIPFIRIYGDCPAYFPNAHRRTWLNSVNSYFDSTQVEFYRRWFKDAATTVVLPPVIHNPLPLDEVPASAKLQGKIIFPKNGNSPASLRRYWRTALPEIVRSGLEAVAEECTSPEQIGQWPGFDERLLSHYSALGIDLSADAGLLCFMVAQLDDYLRRVKSNLIAEAILDLPVIIRGARWDHLDIAGKRAILDSDTDFFRTEPLIDQAPAIIDMSPNTVDTPHDRICRAAGRGTAFLTNRQTFLDGLIDNPGRFFFDFDRQSIHDCVEHFVLNPAEAVELGMVQAQQLRARYSEDKFRESLRSIVQLMAFKLGESPPGTQNFVHFHMHFL